MATKYVHDIPAWMDGTENLSNGEYRAYHVICQLIYLQEGPIVPNEKGIAGRCNQHILEFRRHLQSLIAKTKLFIVNGKLDNRRAEVEIDRMHTRFPKLKPPTNPPTTPAQPPGGSRGKLLKTKKAGSLHVSNRLSFLEGFSESKGIKEGELFPSSEESSSLRFGVAESEQASLAKWKFDEFWRQYPHKVGKRAAVKAFDAARKRGGSFVELMGGLLRYAAKDDDRPWCNPATFLNQERWLDEPAANGGKRRDETIDEQCERLVNQARQLEAERRAERAGRSL